MLHILDNATVSESPENYQKLTQRVRCVWHPKRWHYRESALSKDAVWKTCRPIKKKNLKNVQVEFAV